MKNVQMQISRVAFLALFLALPSAARAADPLPDPVCHDRVDMLGHIEDLRDWNGRIKDIENSEKRMEGYYKRYKDLYGKNINNRRYQTISGFFQGLEDKAKRHRDLLNLIKGRVNRSRGAIESRLRDAIRHPPPEGRSCVSRAQFDREGMEGQLLSVKLSMGSTRTDLRNQIATLASSLPETVNERFKDGHCGRDAPCPRTADNLRQVAGFLRDEQEIVRLKFDYEVSPDSTFGGAAQLLGRFQIPPLLPFAGTGVTMEGDVSGRPDITPGVAAGMTLFVEYVAGKPQPAPGTLKDFITVRVTGKLAAYVGAKAESSVVDAEGRLLSGSFVKYDITMPEERYNPSEIPNLFDPDSIPEGAGLLMRTGIFTGNQLNATFYGIRVETNSEESIGVALGVQKVGPATVRVVLGPTEGVEQNLMLGFKFGRIQFGLGRTAQLDAYHLRTAEYDLSTRDGKAAYRALILSGRIAAEGRGIYRTGTIEKLDVYTRAGFTAQAFDIGLSVQLNSSEGERRLTTYDTGEKVVVLSARINNQAAVITTNFNRAGQQTDKTIQVVLGNVDPAIAAYIHAAVTGAPDSYGQYGRGGKMDVQLTFTEAQALELRDLAKAYVTRALGDARDGVLLGSGAFIQQLAGANDANGVAVVYVRAMHSGFVGEGLLALSLDQNTQIPVTLMLEPS